MSDEERYRADAERLANSTIDPSTIRPTPVAGAVAAILGGLLQAVDEAAAVAALWCALTDEKRHELASTCCRGCGSLDTSCQCWNDE